MILTPLQAIAILVFIVLACSATSWLIATRQQRKFDRQINGILRDVYTANTNHSALELRVQHLEQLQGLKPANDDPMALWDAIVHDASQHHQDQP